MILHIDMDAFYAAVEQRDRPELKGKAVVVGGDGHRGVVSAASYEARKYGVHSAMPIFQARKCCPDAVFVHPRIHHYRAVSTQVMDILRSFSPLVEVVSIDEAFLDVAGCERCCGTPVEIARAIKARVTEELSLTCSVGIAPLKFLAKIASDIHKPDGLHVITPTQVAAFIASLAIEKVPGVGKKTLAQLELLQIRTLGDVKRYSREMLAGRLGKYGHRLTDLAAGRDEAKVVPDGQRKSISSEVTLSEDTSDRELLCRHLLQQAEDVGRQLRKKGLRARTVAVKVKHSDFMQVTRQVALGHPTQSTDCLYRAAKALLGDDVISKKVRLVGVGALGLQPESTPIQMELFGAPNRKKARWEKVETVLDKIDSKFGKGCVRKAGIVDK